MKRLMGLVAVLVVLGGASAYAGDAGSAKLSLSKFSEAPENRGISGRMLERRYDEYRQGRFAVTTLDAQHIR